MFKISEIEFNKENPDRAEPFYFVFCSIDNDFPKDLEERLLKFLILTIGKY